VIRIAHISDLHFGRDIDRVVEALAPTLERLKPELVVISGDLTQRARHVQFENCRQVLDHLAWPLLVVPGNHDLAAYNLVERFLKPWAKWRRYIGADTRVAVSGDHYTALGINTARRLATVLDWTRGRISPTQVQWVEERLRHEKFDRLRLLAAHHPFWLPIERKRRKLIGGRDRALASLAAAGVDVILGGHVHVAYTRVCEGVIISHAGTTTSDRTLPGHPNSFNLIHGDRRQLHIELMVWNGSTFQKQQTHVFLRSAQGWKYAPERKRSVSAGD
jgi:3',5'-cyclic AMP phosphodiesterase CpdA